MNQELNDDVDLLDKEVIEALLKCFEPVYNRAISNNKWFRHEKKDHWFSPQRLKELIAAGRCDTLMGWTLKDPADAIEGLNFQIGMLIEKRERYVFESMNRQFVVAKL
jgi:hypothetical protein